MHKSVVVGCAVLMVLFPLLAIADIAAIQSDKLPQDDAVLAAMQDAAELEPYCRYFVQPWKFPISKMEVAKRLGKDLQLLDSAAKKHPENTELLLLTGLVAHYAYNLDVKNSFEIVLPVLDQAKKQAPEDFRASWFRAGFLCETKETEAGEKGFLSIEDNHTWDQLPVGFWDDYMTCAVVTSMPGHALRAADYLEKLHAPVSDRRTAIVGAMRERFTPFDAKKDYTRDEVWEGINSGDETVFTSTTCGVRFEVPSAWSVERMDLADGSCVADFLTQFYQGTAHLKRPSVLLLVKQPEQGETLDQFSMRFRHKGTFTPFTPARCPAENCIALMAVQPGMYGDDGDGHGRVLFFERGQPEFPNLVLETPAVFPSSASDKPQVYRPGKIAGRIPGKLYYLVLLDTAASIEGPALKDYELFLHNLTVE